MKKIALIAIVALFILTPITAYAYSKNNDSFDWMPHIFMHENHHANMYEWNNEVNLDDMSEEEANWFLNHHNQMYDYNNSKGFGCHN